MHLLLGGCGGSSAVWEKGVLPYILAGWESAGNLLLDLKRSHCSKDHEEAAEIPQETPARQVFDDCSDWTTDLSTSSTVALSSPSGRCLPTPTFSDMQSPPPVPPRTLAVTRRQEDPLCSDEPQQTPSMLNATSCWRYDSSNGTDVSMDVPLACLAVYEVEATARTLLAVLQGPVLVGALSSLEMLHRLPFKFVELTVAGIYALGERAKLRAAELSMDVALTLLYTLDSFEYCVGGDNALDYTLRHTYLINSKEDALSRTRTRMSDFQAALLKRCNYNVWIREEFHLTPALSQLMSTPVLRDMLGNLCSTIRRETRARLSATPSHKQAIAPSTPPTYDIDRHVDTMQACYRFIMEAQRDLNAQVAELQTLNFLSSDVQAKLISRWNSPQSSAEPKGPASYDDDNMPSVTENTPKQSVLLPNQLHDLCTISNAAGLAGVVGNAGLAGKPRHEDSQQHPGAGFPYPGKENVPPAGPPLPAVHGCSIASRLRAVQQTGYNTRQGAIRLSAGTRKVSGACHSRHLGPAARTHRRLPASRVVRYRDLQSHES